jgi:outer membrane protein OmpA-like peptidoglycan-associated protein
VYFDHDSTAISTAGGATIRNAAQYARQSTRSRITLTGHTDRSGGAAYNMNLSLRRAEAVKKALVDQGVPADAIEARGRGETQPLVMTPDGVREPQNNRVEFVIQ